jgi:hypothetical protein
MPLLSAINANALSFSFTLTGHVYGIEKTVVADLLIKIKPKTTVYN